MYICAPELKPFLFCLVQQHARSTRAAGHHDVVEARVCRLPVPVAVEDVSRKLAEIPRLRELRVSFVGEDRDVTSVRHSNIVQAVSVQVQDHGIIGVQQSRRAEVFDTREISLTIIKVSG